MSIKNMCKTQVVTIEKNFTLKDVSELMNKQHVGSIVVTENFNGKRIPCGIITDRDMALAMGSAAKPQDIRVEQIMQSQPITIQGSEGIFEALVKMREYGVRRLPVVETDGSLCGIISSEDILGLMSEELSNISKITDVQLDAEKGVRKPIEKQVLM